MRVLAAWNNYRGSGAREENSLRDFTLEKLYGRWAIMLVTLIYLYQRKAWYTLYSAEENV